MLREADAAGRVLVVDETRHDRRGRRGRRHRRWSSTGFGGPIRRVASADTFVPLGPAAAHVLLGEDEIEKAAWSWWPLGVQGAVTDEGKERP